MQIISMVLTELEKYKNLQTNDKEQYVKQSYQFENQFHEKLYNYCKAHKAIDVYDILTEQFRDWYQDAIISTNNIKAIPCARTVTYKAALTIIEKFTEKPPEESLPKVRESYNNKIKEQGEDKEMITYLRGYCKYWHNKEIEEPEDDKPT